MEDGREVRADHFVIVDVDLVEDGLVEVASLLIVRGQVLCVGVGEQVAAGLQSLSEQVFVVALLGQLEVESASLCRDPVLFAA